MSTTFLEATVTGKEIAVELYPWAHRGLEVFPKKLEVKLAAPTEL